MAPFANSERKKEYDRERWRRKSKKARQKRWQELKDWWAKRDLEEVETRRKEIERLEQQKFINMTPHEFKLWKKGQEALNDIPRESDAIPNSEDLIKDRDLDNSDGKAN